MSYSRYETSLGSRLLLLPTEIIAEIFKNACSVDFDTLSQRKDNLTTPLTLGAVCKPWRDIVWPFSTLWSTIVLLASYERCNTQLDILDLWLTRSGRFPLSVYFSLIPLSNADWETDPPLAMLEKIMEHCERWKHIDMCIIDDPECKFVKLLEKIKGRVPLLRKGHLRQFENATVPRAQLDMFEIAPLLRSFCISILYLEDITLPWTQLTSFRARISEDECVQVLFRCPNLVDCTLFAIFSGPDQHFPSFPSIFTMKHLRSLKITNTDGNIVGNILQHIRCPALRELRPGSTISSLWGSIHLLFRPTDESINRSECSLEVLGMDTHRLHRSIFPILQRLRTLKSLTLRSQNSAGHDCFFGDLTGKPDISPGDPPTFLPELTEVRYATPDSVLDFSIVLEVLRTRWDIPPLGVPRLERFYLEGTFRFDNSHTLYVSKLVLVEGFKDLARQGMRISIPTEDTMDTYLAA
ncbi:hypothetical protein BDQ17DRAFT_1365279 [Cyathus striatus]|nr:hypothetical protein BDQ17DRAFT_1365279 [Cyathus striatus]